ncbi:hypothetical protein GGI05_004273 [Coemansia sp. RSA 2603]|nr:hypothetical protein GGI05_004273 [Coemansia sp. RSA 2603]
MALFQPQSTAVLAPSGRGNDNGFVFRRGRNVAALSSKAARLLAAATSAKTQGSTAAERRDENLSPPNFITTPLAKKRQLAPLPAGSRLDFPEPKRRLTQRATELTADISVPLQRPPQPTPLKPRTRTPMLATGAASAARPSGRRKSTLNRRRSTFSMRGKRASSIGGGFKAVPHASVGSGDFFRHISPELPEPVRLRQLLAWCARRTLPSATWPDGLPDAVQRLLSDALREAVDDMHLAFEKEAIVTSWYHRPVGPTEDDADQPLCPHPENEANARARDALQARIAALRQEELAWVAEQKRASAAHARCLDRLPRAVRELSARPADGQLAEPLLARSDDTVDWKAALVPADNDDATGAQLLSYVEARADIEAEALAADRDVARALDDLQVLLDAFHLDVHRASRKHVHAAEKSQAVAADLGFALAQRRAKAAVFRPADAGLLPSKHQPPGHDATRDLLRTLAAATARRS